MPESNSKAWRFAPQAIETFNETSIFSFGLGATVDMNNKLTHLKAFTELVSLLLIS
jgi:hypothetical protein